MFGDGALAFREYARRERLPLAVVHDAVLDFLRERKDAALTGALAVNAYVDEARMTDVVDVLSTRAEELANELRDHLAAHFHIAVRVRQVGKGRGYRLFQVRKPANRHLVDVRPVAVLPPSRKIRSVPVITPEELVAHKVLAWHQRRGQPKSGTDWRDLAVLLLAFPQLKQQHGAVEQSLKAAGAGAGVLTAWKELVVQKIMPAREDDEF